METTAQLRRQAEIGAEISALARPLHPERYAPDGSPLIGYAGSWWAERLVSWAQGVAAADRPLQPMTVGTAAPVPPARAARLERHPDVPPEPPILEPERDADAPYAWVREASR